MSYILDALKKADAARERGQVPGLHSQRTMGAAQAPSRESVGRLPVIVLAGLVLVLLAAAAAWWWQTARPHTAAVAAHTLPAAAPASATVPTGMVPPAPPVPVPVPVPVPPILAPQLPTATVAPPSNAGAQDAASAETQPTASATATPTPTYAADAATATAAPTRAAAAVRSFAELAPEVRAQLPQVSVSGSTYSTNPAHRMLIANGQVVREGEEIAPGLKLENIGPRSAVLNHNGTRYSIGY